MAEAEIITRRRKWSAEEKAALLSEVDAEGGRVAMVARRHGLSESLLYNWRSVAQAAADRDGPEPIEFVPVGVIDRASEVRPVLADRTRASILRQRASGRSCRRDRDSAPERRADPRQCVGEREGVVAGVPRAEGCGVISLAPGTKVFLACRPVDLRNGFDGLAAKAQQIIGADPFSGHLFLFRGKRGDYLRRCTGMAAVSACLPSGWRRAASCGHRSSMAAMTLTPAQLALLIEAMDWRRTVAPPLPTPPMLV